MKDSNYSMLICLNSTRSITFRGEVRPSDCQDVLRIVASTGFFTPEETGVAVELVEERLSKGERSGYRFLFAEKGGTVVGYTCFGPIACTKGSYDLYWIAIQEECRGHGLGKTLLKMSEDLIAREGGRRIYVETSSRTKYEPTRSFYRGCGYSEDAVLRDFYALGDDKVVYVKVIDSGISREDG